MDLDAALNLHADLKFALRHAIAHKLPVVMTTVTADACPLGHYLEGVAHLKYKHLPDYGRCVKDHRAFHVEAVAVAMAVNKRDFDVAARLLALGSAYHLALKDLTVSTEKFKRAMARPLR